MKTNRLANIAYGLIIFMIVGYLLLAGKTLVIPIIFGIIFSFLLYPICKQLENWRMPRIPAILLTMIGVMLLIVGILSLFSSQFINLFADFEDFKMRLMKTFEKALAWVYELPALENNLDNILKEGGMKILSSVQGMLGSTLVNSSMFIGYAGMVIVYIFLFLLYRSAFKQFILNRFPEEKREQTAETLNRFQRVTQKYFTGLLLAILIIGSLNTIGLFIIGIDHAFLFGFFAAFLTIIPYVGTTLGGMLPFLYALINYDDYWKAIAVLIMYQIVQQLEGNFITPKIVGSQVSINPLFAIIVLIFGAFFWGISGMVLSIPLTALIKIALESSEKTRPYAFMMSSEFNEKTGGPKIQWKKLFSKKK